MKKLFCLALAVMMVIGCLTGCGGAKEEAAPAPAPAAKEEAAPAPAPEAKEEAPVEEAVEVVELDIANHYPEGTVVDLALIELTDILNESGLFKATYYPNSQLGSLYDYMESAMAGSNIVCVGGGSDWGDRVNVPLMSVVMTPFLITENEDSWGVFGADYFKEMLVEAEAANIKLINAPIANGRRYFMGNSKIITPDDYKGLKIRVPNSSMYLNTFSTFGAVPTPMAVSEVYTALAQKMVDELEHPYADALSSQYYEVIKYASDTPYLNAPALVGLSLQVWNSMNEEQQKVFTEAVEEISAFTFETIDAMEAEAKAELEAKGVEFYTPDIEQFRALMPQYYELAGWTDEFAATVTEAMDAYQASK